MTIPFVIDNAEHRLADALNELLAKGEGKPLDIATAYFAISGYRLVQKGLQGLGAFRLLIGSDPKTGSDAGLKPSHKAIEARLQGDVQAEPFTPATLRLVEDLIGFLREERVEVRLYERGFLHAKAYLFHQDSVGRENRHDRLRPYAAIVGSSNFTGPGLASNRELNLVHRVITADDVAVDRQAAETLDYLRLSGSQADPALRLEDGREVAKAETLLDPSGIDVPDAARRFIKSEVGARAVSELTLWFERHWAESVEFKETLIELLDASKFGTKEYTPYQVYIKALYEYFRDELGDDALELGRSAVDLAEFQEDAVKKARRILGRYDGVLIADSVGLGKTWIGKKLLEDFAYHRRQKAVVVCPASLRPMWQKELASATIAATVVGMEELGRDEFDGRGIADADCILIDESHNFRNAKANRYLALDEAIQRNGRIDRIGSPHSQIGIYNMFPEEELEALLHLIERLTNRISAIDAFGLLDASILGEVVHPRTFNTLRRIRDQDDAVLDEEEARAELAGPELLLKHLKEVLNKEAAESIADLPNGIHSGLRRQKAYGTFFYFQAPRTTGEGKRHFWRYIDARSHQILENRFEIAQLIACSPDEPRYIGDQDVFALQDKVIEQILTADREAEARAAAPTAVDPIQQTVAEELKDALRRQTIDREVAKTAIRFLGQPMGRSLHQKLKRIYEAWSSSRDDAAMLAAIAVMAEEFSKDRPPSEPQAALRPEDLTLICFEYVTG